MATRLDPNTLFFRDSIKGNVANSFSGREDLIKKGLNSIGGDGSCVIFGERGIGKTSLAWQIATTLNETNKTFSKRELMSIGVDATYRCVFFKCHQGIVDLNTLLIGLLRPSGDPYSLSKVFEKVYEDKKANDRIQRKYELNFLALAKVRLDFTPGESTSLASEIAKHEPAINLAPQLFEDALFEIKAAYGNDRVVIFIDEADQIKNKDGFGGFLKNQNLAQFVFVGIADDLKSIIVDHESAGRKLVGGDILVPPMSGPRIEWIINNAEQRARGGLHFSENFKQMVVRYSDGFPWLAQQICYSALKNEIIKRHGKVVSSVVINASAFDEAMKEVTSIYESEVATKVELVAATESKAHAAVLLSIWNDGPLSEEQLRERLDDNFARHVGHVLPKLKRSGILRAGGSSKVRFSTPIVRILCKYKIDKESQ
jgi:hypothetical protein